jgi:hypothetical protein
MNDVQADAKAIFLEALVSVESTALVGMDSAAGDPAAKSVRHAGSS